MTPRSKASTLDVLPGEYAICRWGAGEPLPPWVMQGEFFSVTRTPAELSAICDRARVPAGVTAEGPWRVLAVRGPLDFGMTGVMAALLAPLAAAGISILAISSYDTDFVLVRNEERNRALSVLREAGHTIEAPGVL